MNIKHRLWIGPLILMLVLSAFFTVYGKDISAQTKESDSENGIRIEVTYGYGNHVKGGRYIPVEVWLGNGGEEEFQGNIRILTMESDYDIYRHGFPVTIPAKGEERKQVYFPIGNRSDQMFVELTDQNGKQVLNKRIKLNFSLES